MFGALRDCVPQLKNAKHEEDPDKMVSDFKEKIMDIMKEVSSFYFCLIFFVN